MRDPVALRRRAGTRGDPTRDQYFLEDTRVLARIISYARDVDPDLEHVLEIGPGIGGLTGFLVNSATTVTAIERDRALVRFLRDEFAPELDTGRLMLVEGDALKAPFPDYSSCVSNLPYGISGPVLFRLLPRRRPIVVMVQLEFGQRMAAEPGADEYGRLSVATQHFGEVRLCETIPPSVFQPQPPVDSAIVSVRPREPDYDVPDEGFFLDFLRAVFTQRRKTLRNAIRNTTHISGITDATAILERVDVELLDRRPGELEPIEFARIATIAHRQERTDD